MSEAPAVRVIPPGVTGRDLDEKPYSWRGTMMPAGKRKPRTCSKCGEEGHNALTCAKGGGGKPKAKPAGAGIVLKTDAREIVLRLRVLVSIETA